MNAKVIASSFLGERQVRKSGGFPMHAQLNETPEDILAMLTNVLSYEKTLEAGVPVDTIVVLNGHSPFNVEIQSRFPEFTFLERENIGGSFGAYSHAFITFEDKYDYWLFTEDDIVVGGPDYYKRLLDTFQAEDDMGFLALIERVRHHLGTHAHGGIGLTSTKVLRELAEPRDSLPHYRGEGWDKDKIIRFGEVPFTNEILNLGYTIGEFCPAKEWNYEKKLCTPYADFHEIH